MVWVKKLKVEAMVGYGSGNWIRLEICEAYSDTAKN